MCEISAFVELGTPISDRYCGSSGVHATFRELVEKIRWVSSGIDTHTSFLSSNESSSGASQSPCAYAPLEFKMRSNARSAQAFPRSDLRVLQITSRSNLRLRPKLRSPVELIVAAFVEIVPTAVYGHKQFQFRHYGAKLQLLVLSVRLVTCFHGHLDWGSSAVSSHFER